MPDEKISAMTLAAAVGPTDLVPIVQGGANFAAAVEQIWVSLAVNIAADVTGGGDLVFVDALPQLAIASPRCLFFDVSGSIGPFGTATTLYVGDGTSHVHSGMISLWDPGFTSWLSLKALNGTLVTGNAFVAAQIGTTNDPGLIMTGLANFAGAAIGTLTNSPSAGNPTIWVQVSVNGVYYKLPLWS
jgi:hypothetical protein